MTLIDGSMPTASARPQSGRLVGRPRKLWVTAHVVTSVGWLGGAYCMLILGMTGLLSSDTGMRVASYDLMHLFDRAMNIPLGLLAIGTGLVLSLKTKWGLFRHRWVAMKFLLSIAITVLAPIASVPRLSEAIAALRVGRDLGWTSVQIVIISLCVVVTLTFVTGVSVFKPWGRVRRARRSTGGRSQYAVLRCSA